MNSRSNMFKLLLIQTRRRIYQYFFIKNIGQKKKKKKKKKNEKKREVEYRGKKDHQGPPPLMKLFPSLPTAKFNQIYYNNNLLSQELIKINKN